MHIKNQAQLKQLQKQQSISPRVSAQLEHALESAQKQARTKKHKGAPAARQLASVVRQLGSEGEEALNVALLREFGCWKQGGELVRELMPFSENRYRADLCFPRYLISVEIQGWTHHGKSLDDHHDDRIREMYFAARNWLVINVSHGQALNQQAMIIDTIRQAMTRRVPLHRDMLIITEHPTPQNLWHRLTFNESDSKPAPMPLSTY
ncbi:hypothetical protein [Marinobacter sp. MBR-105]